MLKIDQLVIENTGSYDEFEASVAERKIEAPKKKSIKETVPFSNEIYDFSAINGEVYWEERTLEYVFEITAMSAEKLEEKKQPFVSWIMNIKEAKIYDPFIADFHFVGTFDSISFDDSEIEKSTITVKFTAYPYMIANKKRFFKFNLTESAAVVKNVFNNSSHRITPTFISDVPVTLEVGGESYSIPAGETTDDSFKLEPGVSAITLQSTGGSGSVTIEFCEEVF